MISKTLRLTSETWAEVAAYQARVGALHGHRATPYAPERMSLPEAVRYLLWRGLAPVWCPTPVAVPKQKNIVKSIRLTPQMSTKVEAYRDRLQGPNQHVSLAFTMRYLVRRGLAIENHSMDGWDRDPRVITLG